MRRAECLKWSRPTIFRTFGKDVRVEYTAKGQIYGILTLNEEYNLTNGARGKGYCGYIWDEDCAVFWNAKEALACFQAIQCLYRNKQV